MTAPTTVAGRATPTLRWFEDLGDGRHAIIYAPPELEGLKVVQLLDARGPALVVLGMADGGLPPHYRAAWRCVMESGGVVIVITDEAGADSVARRTWAHGVIH